jgi:hypothetical protein
LEHLVFSHHTLLRFSYLAHAVGEREQAALREEAAHVLTLRAQVSRDDAVREAGHLHVVREAGPAPCRRAHRIAMKVMNMITVPTIQCFVLYANIDERNNANGIIF